jgi:TPR repeat protein
MTKKQTRPTLLISLLLILLANHTALAQGDLEAGLAAFAAGDFATARQQLQPLADAGDAQAQFTLSWMYRAGNGVPMNMNEAGRLLQLAADQGHADAQTELATLMFYGIGVPPDVLGAVGLLERAAAQGHAPAQVKLGEIYVQGSYIPRVPRNIPVGMRMLELAVEQGYVPGMHALGEIRYYGEKDFIAASTLFQQAAAEGHADSMFFLANMYMNGEWLPQDAVKAYMWAQLSVDLGNNNGDILRTQIAEELTANDIFMAEGMARECQARQFKDC